MAICNFSNNSFTLSVTPAQFRSVPVLARLTFAPRRTTLATVIAVVLLGGCGGGGSSGGGSGGGVWGTARLIETDNLGSASLPQIAVDLKGNAVAVWSQSDSVRFNIWSNTYDAKNGSWGTAVLLETNDVSHASSPQVAVGPNGNAVAVWTQSDGTRYNIWSSTHNAGSGTWTTAQLIETDNAGNALGPQIAVDPNGNAVAVWNQSDGIRDNIWSNTYSATSGTWGSAQLIELNNTGDAVEPQLAMDAIGNAVAVWYQSDGTRFNIWSNRYTAASGTWSTPQLIELDNTGSALAPQVAVDPNGNAVAVWQQHDGTRSNIWSNRYTAASGSWGSAQLIELDNTGGAFDPRVAVDANGNAVSVWYQSDGTRDNIWTNRYRASSSTWGTAQLIETDAGEAFGPRVAVNANGNAVAVWSQSDGTRSNIWARHYNATSDSWNAPQLIETNNTGGAFEPQVAAGPNGSAVAVWPQFDGSHDNIWANRFH